MSGSCSDALSTLPGVPRVVAPAGSSASWLAHRISRAADEGAPLIVELGANSSLLPQWTPAVLINRVNVLTRVYVGDSARFGPYYDGDRPMARAGLTRAPAHAYSEADLPTRSFFASHSHYRYYSGEVERDLPKSMLAELRPLESALIARNPSHASVNLWLGASPVVAPCHYDAYHNAAVQLAGSKRWMIAPPSAWPVLRPYPFLHPSHAQCQVSLDSIEADALAALGGMSAPLAPGDLLYLPPLWFHETLALSEEGAVGINGWVACEESDAAAALFALRRPRLTLQARLDADGSVSGSGGGGTGGGGGAGSTGVGVAAALLVRSLSSEVFGNAGALVARVWSERYATLEAGRGWQDGNANGGEAPHKLPSALPLQCAELREWDEAWGDRDVAELSAASHAVPRPTAGVGARAAVTVQREAVGSWARKAAQIALSGLGEDTRGTWVANLAELVAAEQVGVGAIAEFWRILHQCQTREAQH